MAHPRKFRFGVQAATAASAEAWKDIARRAEALGYSTLFMPDHFEDQLAPVPALMAAADATTDLRIGALVWCNDYKHPVVLAKEVATLDVLSGGRVEFGIGAGWMNTDYAQAGIEKDRDGVRIERMEEALAVYKGLWGEGPVSVAGKHYTITEMNGLPKPVQAGGPPILIGGGGPKVLGIAGRHADIVGINPKLTQGEINAEAARDGAADRVDQKIAWLRDGAGDRFDDLEINALVFVSQITDDPGPTREMMAAVFGVTADEVADTPYAWVGSVGEICDQLRSARERWGFSYFTVRAENMEAMAPIVAELAGT